MIELSKFVKARATDNVQSGTVSQIFTDNPQLFMVKMPDGRTLTLPSAKPLTLTVGDVVEVAMPSGDRKRAYVVDKAATVMGGDPTNRVLALGQG